MEEKSLLKKVSMATGWRFAIFGLVTVIVELGFRWMMQQLCPDIVESNVAEISFLSIIAAVDLVGFPLLWLLLHSVPAKKPEVHKMKFWQIIICIFICAGLVLMGTIVGNIVHFSLTLPFGIDFSEVNKLGSLMLESSPFLRILTVGILAPIFEELIFRKLLIDRIGQYSELGAVLLSGIMFGLYHGNFQQFFFASALGMFFAYIYLRTGKIWYTILFHMVINMSSAAVVVTLLGYAQKGMDQLNAAAATPGNASVSVGTMIPIILLAVWLMIMGATSIAGSIIFFVQKKKMHLVKHDNLGKSEIISNVFGNWGFVLFAIVCAGLFVYSYAPGVIDFICK